MVLILCWSLNSSPLHLTDSRYRVIISLVIERDDGDENAKLQLNKSKTIETTKSNSLWSQSFGPIRAFVCVISNCMEFLWFFFVLSVFFSTVFPNNVPNEYENNAVLFVSHIRRWEFSFTAIQFRSVVSIPNGTVRQCSI